MTTPVPNPNEPSRMKKILNASPEDSVTSRLPRANGGRPYQPAAAKPAPARRPVTTKLTQPRFKFLPAFWTIASIMSFTVNIVVLIVLLLLVQNRGSVTTLANDQVTVLLGGLYDNFVMMDRATIKKDIVVDANIPLNITVPVNLANEEITLASDAVITRAHVEIYQGGVNINAPAKVTLPAGTKLNVDLSFDLPVQNTIPVHLDVPVSIPLSDTELHEPFVGLQEVVKPWYCVMQPNAIVSGLEPGSEIRVCDGVSNPLAPVFNLLPHE
jgi:hypothetical protein